MPPKKRPDLRVGARIECPGRVFGRPNDPAYPGVILAVRGDKVDIRFAEDGSKYWFPAADVAAWVVDGGSAATSPARATAMTRSPARGRPAGRGGAAAAAPASPSPQPGGGRAGAPRPMVRAATATRGAGGGGAGAATTSTTGRSKGRSKGRPRLRSAGAVFNWLPFVSDSAALAAMGVGLAALATAVSYWLLRVAAPGPDGSIPLA